MPPIWQPLLDFVSDRVNRETLQLILTRQEQIMTAASEIKGILTEVKGVVAKVSKDTDKILALAGTEGAINAEDAAEIRLLASGILSDANAVDAKVPEDEPPAEPT